MLLDLASVPLDLALMPLDLASVPLDLALMPFKTEIIQGHFGLALFVPYFEAWYYY